MDRGKVPHFTIKNKFQKKACLYSEILTPKILRDVCMRITGCGKYTVGFDSEGYNKGRLAKLEYLGATTYISFSETELIGGRNSSFQSIATALVHFYLDTNPKKNFYFYFLPHSGNIETNYFMFMYRLMKTAGVDFLNSAEILTYRIHPFITIDDLIAAREINRRSNRSNNSTYVTRSDHGKTLIYGKTYGANKKETTLLCLAAAQISQSIELYEICEQDLSELPAPDLAAIKSLGNVEVFPTDLTMEKFKFEEQNSIRSPRFIYNLLDRLGPKKCSFCDCEIPELIEGAHVWPVANIKRINSLSIEDKIKHATDGNNGLWLCDNHHTMFDEALVTINKIGEIKYKKSLPDKAVDFILNTTPVPKLPSEIFTVDFAKYLQYRYKDAV